MSPCVPPHTPHPAVEFLLRKLCGVWPKLRRARVGTELPASLVFDHWKIVVVDWKFVIE